MSNFRERLDALNNQVAEFDKLQGMTEELEADLAATRSARDKALDAVHDIVRDLNNMLPTRPEDATPPQETSQAFSSNW